MILLVDGMNQAVVSNMTKPLSTDYGLPTQAIYGFFKALRFYLDNFEVSEVITVFDGKHSKARIKLKPDYKERDSKKDPATEERMKQLEPQIPIIKAMLSLLGSDAVIGPEMEADDVIAILVAGFKKQGRRCMIISGDKDFHQLVDDDVEIFKPTQSSKVRHITTNNFEEVFGMRPDQWLDFRAMMGDSSDNIDGCKGVGEKTALGIVQEFGSYKDFIVAAAFGPEKTPLNSYQKKALADRDGYELARKLMDLKNFDLMGDPKNIKITQGKANISKLKELFERLQFYDALENFGAWSRLFPAFRLGKDIPY